MTKRKYRTDEEWLSLIQECRLSGLTDKQWCEAHKICPSNFYGELGTWYPYNFSTAYAFECLSRIYQ